MSANKTQKCTSLIELKSNYYICFSVRSFIHMDATAKIKKTKTKKTHTRQGIVFQTNKRSVLRWQSRDTDRNMKRLVYCRYG